MIWDLDGTLADTLPLCVTAFRHIFEGYGDRPYRDEEIIALFGPSASAIGMVCNGA
jgi:phosphoglycolate phosphatase/pyrophosphatase PpaX